MLLQIEDRPIIKEIKTYIREHHPIEKEFVVETRPTGKFAYNICTVWCSASYSVYMSRPAHIHVLR